MEIVKNKYSRRSFLKGALGLAGAAMVTKDVHLPSLAAAADASKPVYMANVIRTLSHDYHATWNRGGRLFAESVGQGGNYTALLCEGDSEKQLTLMKAFITKGGKDTLFNIDPNQSPDATPIAKLCAESGVYLVTQWNKPDDLHPWDYDPYWVCHMGVNGTPAGYAVAKELFKAMGGKGKIVALQGMLANVPAIQRFNGLKMALAENPDIELLEEQTAEWDPTKALQIMETWITKYPKIDGVWAANDGMGVAALQALKAENLNGKVPVCGIDADKEAVQACIDGEFAATLASDALWQGAMGLSLAYHAYNGTFDPAKEPKLHREFYFNYILVTKDNAKEYWHNNIEDMEHLDYNDIWGRVAEQITYPYRRLTCAGLRRQARRTQSN